VGRAADLEQAVVLADGHVLGHIAASLAEKPHGGAVDGLAEAGADEAAGGVRGGNSHKVQASTGGAVAV
ncbi:MAG TPA: hypothetical protein VKV02_14285, partial [Acidobacteriaceae bacterium]|nr:hypothetical protein [Acidobacteriaceae bacterium]